MQKHAVKNALCQLYHFCILSSSLHPVGLTLAVLYFMLYGIVLFTLYMNED